MTDDRTVPVAPHADSNDLERARALLDRAGHVTVDGLVDGTVLDRFRDIVEAAVARARKVELPPGNEEYQRAFDQYMNLWQFDDAVREITLDPRLGSVAAELLGVEAVRVYHDQALIKVAGGGPTPWHQDQWYWPLDTDRTITMWLPLHDVDPAMGDLEFASGTQRGPIGDEPISGASDRLYERWVADQGNTTTRTGAMAAGSASFHLGWTLHRANPNLTALDRKVMTVIWFADGARAVEPANGGQRFDLALWLPGVRVGEPAASPINPRIARPAD